MICCHFIKKKLRTPGPHIMRFWGLGKPFKLQLYFGLNLSVVHCNNGDTSMPNWYEMILVVDFFPVMSCGDFILLI